MLCQAADWIWDIDISTTEIQARSLRPAKIEGDFSVRPVRRSDSLVHLLRECFANKICHDC
jgi:hypothetical protein